MLGTPFVFHSTRTRTWPPREPIFRGSKVYSTDFANVSSPSHTITFVYVVDVPFTSSLWTMAMEGKKGGMAG